jgi:hypothetical protein
VESVLSSVIEAMHAEDEDLPDARKNATAEPVAKKRKRRESGDGDDSPKQKKSKKKSKKSERREEDEKSDGRVIADDDIDAEKEVK